MKSVVVIATNTFREAVRDKVLYLFLGFAAVLLVSAKLFGMLTVGDEAKVIKDLGLGGIQFFAMLIAVMMSVLLVSREVDRRTVFNIIAKPVHRWQFLVGKYLGLLATVAVNIVVMALILVAVLWVFEGAFEPLLFLGAGMTLLEMVVVSAAAVFFAVVTKPILGSIFTLALFIVGHLAQDLWMLTGHLGPSLGRGLAAVMYYAVPNLERFNLKVELVHGLPIPWPAVGLSVFYALFWAGLFLVLAALRFRTKDLQ
jgi:ABC-type transport system involved in multi-copper enzyme maturation permease subunit